MFPIELLGWTGGRDIGRIQPSHIARFKREGFMVRVVLFGLEILRVLDILNKTFMSFMEIGCEFFRSGSSM